MRDNKKSRLKSLAKIVKYLKPYKKQTIIGPIAKITEAVIELATPFFMALLIDSLVDHQGDLLYFFKIGAVLLALVLLSFAFSFVCQYMASLASQGVGTKLREDVYKKIQTFSYRQLDSYGSVSLSTRLTMDINNIQFAVAMFIRLFFRSPLLIIGSTIAALVIATEISWIFFPLIIIIFILLAIITKQTVPLQEQAQKDTDKLAGLVQDHLSGVRIIRAFNKSAHEREYFSKNNQILNKSLEQAGGFSAILSPASTFVINLAIVFVLIAGGDAIKFGSLSSGQLIALINYLNLVLQGVTVLTNLLMEVPRTLASCDRLVEVLDTEAEIIPMTEIEIIEKDKSIFRFNQEGKRESSYDALLNVKTANTSSDILEIHNLDFAYSKESKKILDNINLNLERTKKLGIIGPTGSGKSTLAKIIQRFYDASFGQVLINGKDSRSFTRDELVSQIAYVPQKALLFDGSLRDNLALGLETEEISGFSEEELDDIIWTSLKIAQAYDFVKDLKDGLDSQVERGGKNFSGGQRQRLCIARALIRKAPIIIFDDSSSALDYATEAKLNHALNSLDWQPAVIIISQRIRSLKGVDEIIVMDKGRIEARGKHEDLLRDSLLYQEIYYSQNTREAANE